MSKSTKNKIFNEFPVFEYALWEKMKSRKNRKSTESFLNQKASNGNGLPVLKNC